MDGCGDMHLGNSLVDLFSKVFIVPRHQLTVDNKGVRNKSVDDFQGCGVGGRIEAGGDSVRGWS